MDRKTIFSRIGISLLVGILLGALISEVTFRLLNNVEARPPQRIELVIPPGTADRVARGESSPAIPDDLTLVVGDTLVVVNQDTADHRLGPLFVPAGTSASLDLPRSESLSYSCSFQTSRYIDLDVREPLDWGTRLQGILFAGLPMGALIAIYSLIAGPARKEKA